jgi:hypothetical protein
MYKQSYKGRTLIVIVTDHKTGHNLLSKIFAVISKSLGLCYYDISLKESIPSDADIVLFELSPPPKQITREFKQSAFTKIKMLPNNIKGVHMIRNPFEVIVSAYNHHRRINKPWVHERREEFDNKSYREQLCNLNTDNGLIFEMNHISKSTILDMYEWDYSDDRFLNVKLEDFFDDFDKTAALIAEFLDLDPEKVVSIANKHNIYHLIDKNNIPDHVTNRTGKKYRYPDFFKEKHYDCFFKLFQSDIFDKLGYDNKDQDPESCND